MLYLDLGVAGCTTSLRKRIFRPSNPDPIGARSIDEITVSVTLEGVIGPGFIASTAVLPGGQSAAHDWAGIIDNAHTAIAVIIRVLESLEITLIGRTPAKDNSVPGRMPSCAASPRVLVPKLCVVSLSPTF